MAADIATVLVAVLVNAWSTVLKLTATASSSSSSSSSSEHQGSYEQQQ
jgi:hypothetical protein